jgi:hypothetical protein
VTAPDGDLRTALIAEIPAAEPVVGRYRDQLDATMALGIPAHVTILAPFAPVGGLGTAELDRLSRLFAAVPAFDVRLDHDVVPHLTVVEAGPVDEMRRAEELVAGQLPVADRVTAVTLLAELSRGGQWRTLASFPPGV